jgi:L-arabinokinase
MAILRRDVEDFKLRLRMDFGDLFQSGSDIYLVRAPARLDVMGGIADYSGAVVLQYPLDRAIVLGLQRRQDRRIAIRSLGLEQEGLSPDYQTSLDSLFIGGQVRSYESLQAQMKRDPRTGWAAYIVGVFQVLLKEGVVVDFPSGATIGVASTIPMGAGIGSSGALEAATMAALAVAYGLKLNGLEMARLCQMAENRVVGAPCGIMDQVASLLGQQGELLALECQPHTLLGSLVLPAGFCTVGLDSGVKHSVGGSRYTDTRIGAFMGHKIIRQYLLSQGHREDPYNGYLCNITPQQYNRAFRQLLPKSISGAEFLARFGETIDPVTAIDPAKTYRPRSRAEHPIYENARVKRFMELVEQAQRGEPSAAMVEAGRLTYASHWSYGKRCGMGAAETDLIVRLVREAGPRKGLYGAKITGGGSGGTVAILAKEDSWDAIEEIAQRYGEEVGHRPELFRGSSPGALDFGYEIARLENSP